MSDANKIFKLKLDISDIVQVNLVLDCIFYLTSIHNIYYHTHTLCDKKQKNSIKVYGKRALSSLISMKVMVIFMRVCNFQHFFRRVNKCYILSVGHHHIYARSTHSARFISSSEFIFITLQLIDWKRINDVLTLLQTTYARLKTLQIDHTRSTSTFTKHPFVFNLLFCHKKKMVVINL